MYKNGEESVKYDKAVNTGTKEMDEIEKLDITDIKSRELNGSRWILGKNYDAAPSYVFEIKIGKRGFLWKKLKTNWELSV